MLSTRWQPMADVQAEVTRLRDEMDRLFGRWTGRRFPLAPAAYPLMNLWEDDENLFVEAELPGLELSDLEIYVHGNQLAVKGERKEPTCEKSTWHRRERGYGKFARVLELPVAVDEDKVEAAFKSGVLTITLPKRAEGKPRRIEVHAD
jgi:HSP20 family protein